MIVLLLILAALVLLSVTPLGAHVIYDSGGPRCELVIGFLKVQLYPKKRKIPKITSKMQKKPQETEEKKQESVGSLVLDIYEFFKICFDFLDHSLRKLRVSILTLHVGFGGMGDPASAAIHYGQAWAAIGTIMPLLRRRLRIKKENVSASCDFTRGELQFFAELKATLLFSDFLFIAFRYGLKALKASASSKKSTKPQLSKKAVQNNEPSTS